MTTQYGVRFKSSDGSFSESNDVWLRSRDEAQKHVDEANEHVLRVLISREPGEVLELTATPTTPGSVILHSNYGHLVLNDKGCWGSYSVAMRTDELERPDLYGWTWSLVFDASSLAGPAVAE